MKTSKITAKNRRKYAHCVCDTCSCEFVRRLDYRNHDNCTACSNTIKGVKLTTHGDNNSNSRLHVTWSNMKRRCFNPTQKEIKGYGMKNISMCDDWLMYINFKKWALDSGYNDKMTIDRINNDGNYCPENCRFVDYSTNNANRGITSRNKSGYIGVWFDGLKYISKVGWMGVRNHIGRFVTAEEAAIKRNEFIVKNKLPHTMNKIKQLGEL